FPVFGWVIRGFSWLTFSSALITALTIALVFGAAATLFVYMLVADACGAAAGRRASALFCFFPGAFVLSMASAASLMVAAVTGALLAYTRRRWVPPGVPGAAAAMTRPNA